MDEYIFYCYMKYQKDNNPDIIKRLKVLPKHILIMMIVAVVAFVVSLVALFVGNEMISSLCIFIMAIFSFLLYWRVDNYQIKKSEKVIDRYKTICSELEEWLKTLGIETNEDIQLLYNRLTERISKQKETREKSNNRVDKWIQVLAIPLLLCIISEIIKSDVDISIAITNVFVAILIGALVFLGVYVCQIIKWFPIKRKIVQMQYFADDLRAILDCKQLFGSDDFKEKSEKDNVQVCKG